MREADDLLEQIETAALSLERNSDDSESVHLLFRAFHTLKGSSAMVGLEAIAEFTHHVETTLDRVREGKLDVTPTLISAILAAKDHIQAELSAEPGSQRGEAAAAPIVACFAELCRSASLAPAAQSLTKVRTTYEIAFRLKREADGFALDPQDLIAELCALGACQVAEVGPPDDEFGAAWQVTLVTNATEATLRDVFIFAPSGSMLRVERGLTEFVTDPPQAELAASALLPRARGEGTGAEGPRSSARKQDTVRVPSARLDKLVKLVGELVINQARLHQAHAHGGGAELAGPVEAMERLIAELRDSVFDIRMMPIGPTFARFKRLARDLSTQLGKEIELATEGDETELDKTVLDQLGDPLVHLIRNSMDHGIELPAERVASGKSPKGRVLLTAAHEGGHVLITIKDDGRGLDRSAIRAKAEAKGLIDPGQHLSEQETFELIMRPGFSTATAVTQLSGRGVGLDVVKKTIESLRGSLAIESVAGRGTTIRLSLPLTLAIIDGLLVEVKGDHYIVPMAAVTENVELTRHERAANNGRNTVAVRGELVPYMRLRELFSVEGDDPAIEKVVIVTLDGQRLGLVVDSVVGSHQTVIQPLGPFYRDIALFSGTTIMGDGRVVMIIDLAGTLRHTERRDAPHPSERTLHHIDGTGERTESPWA